MGPNYLNGKKTFWRRASKPAHKDVLIDVLDERVKSKTDFNQQFEIALQFARLEAGALNYCFGEFSEFYVKCVKCLNFQSDGRQFNEFTVKIPTKFLLFISFIQLNHRISHTYVFPPSLYSICCAYCFHPIFATFSIWSSAMLRYAISTFFSNWR